MSAKSSSTLHPSTRGPAIRQTELDREILDLTQRREGAKNSAKKRIDFFAFLRALAPLRETSNAFIGPKKKPRNAPYAIHATLAGAQQRRVESG
jgi:hypothetical protein